MDMNLRPASNTINNAASPVPADPASLPSEGAPSFGEVWRANRPTTTGAGAVEVQREQATAQAAIIQVQGRMPGRPLAAPAEPGSQGLPPMTEIAAAIQRLLTDPPDSESVASDLPLAPEIEEAEVAEQAMVLAMPMFIAVGGGPSRLSLVAEFSEGGAGAPLNHMAAATAGGLPTPSAPPAPLVLDQSQTANLASGLEAAEAMILPDLALGQGREVKEGGAGGVQGFSIPGVAPQPSSRADLSLSAAMPVASDVTLNMNNQKAWNHTLGQQLVWMVQNHAQEAELKVNPAHLGPLEVRLSLHQDQADVTFFSHDAMVRDVLEQALPRLREMLSHHGVQLGQATVSDQSLARQQQEAGGRPSGQDAQEARGGGAAEAGLGEDPPPGFQHRPGIVDHYI